MDLHFLRRFKMKKYCQRLEVLMDETRAQHEAHKIEPYADKVTGRIHKETEEQKYLEGVYDGYWYIWLSMGGDASKKSGSFNNLGMGRKRMFVRDKISELAASDDGIKTMCFFFHIMSGGSADGSFSGRGFENEKHREKYIKGLKFASKRTEEVFDEVFGKSASNKWLQWLDESELRKKEESLPVDKIVEKSLGNSGLFKTGEIFPGKGSDGPFKEYYEKGRLKSEGFYKDGKLEGSYKGYYENGKLKGESFYERGKFNGSCKAYYENGQLKAEQLFKDGKEDGPEKHYEYYKDGQLRFEADFMSGKLDGLSRRYYENGNLKEEMGFKDGRPEGTCKDYHEDGKLKRESAYKGGKLDGIVKDYANGKLKSEMVFKNGKPEGLVKEYDENGNFKRMREL